MFEIKNVSKKYKSEYALQDVSLNIKKGLNFIVGPTGSGKTTLLKIMTGMEQDFEGEVYCGGRNIKELSTKDKSYFYNNIFGFIWQDFNLLEDFTVWDNIMLPTYLKDSKQQQAAIKILKDLKIQSLAYKKVKYLSGGQKQRVAVARELIKNPAIIIADEPTSALDTKSAKVMIELLRVISKKRTVIVVTHDTSLIQDSDTVFKLDKGELIQSTSNETTTAYSLKLPIFKKLSWQSAFKVTKKNLSNKWGRSLMSIISLLFAGILLLTTFSGTISKGSDAQIQNLLQRYGKILLDIHIVDSFTSASGTSGDQDDPKANVNQDISGLYEKYVNDKRVDFILFMQAFNDIEIEVNGKKHKIQSSGGAPEIKDIIAGKMPKNANEIVIPETFLKQLGKDKDAVIGTEIEFNAAIFKWVNNQPIPKKIKTKAKIVGVADTLLSTEVEGKKIEYTLDDAFFFSKETLDDFRKQADIDNNLDFIMRTKSMTDLISLKNELNKQGIVPLGQFELVEDFVKLDNQSSQQGGAASIMIGVLAAVMLISIFLVSGFMRKREHAIYKASGYHNLHLWKLTLVEIGINAMIAIVIMIISSPLLSIMTSQLFKVSIMSINMLLMGVVMIIIAACIAYFTCAISFVKTNIVNVLKDGSRS